MTDAVREKFNRSWDNFLNKPYRDCSTIEAFAAGYQAAHEEAKALVGELVKALESCQTTYDMSGYVPEHYYDDELVEPALTKAQAFMEGKV